jgi:putative serine protease PepD
VKGPRHLWTGDWRSASHENDEALAERAPLRPPVEDPLAEPAAGAAPAAETEERRGVLRRSPFALALVIAVLAAAGLFTGSLIAGSGDNGNKQTAQSPNALPAVGSKPLVPRKGQTRAGAIYEAASPAVVSVKTELPGGSATGTAFLVGSDGTLVTNDHVVEQGRRVVVRFGRDGASVDADVLGTDPSSDLAVLSIPKSAIPKGVKPLQFADSRNVRVGDMVIAIGNPFGLDQTATQGIVSALGRDIEAPNHYTINNVIQTDAPINPGNSGGPLLDDSAHVIGVNSQIATGGTSQGNIGIGFAVPSNTVRQVFPILKRGGTISRAYLGVQTRIPDPGNGNGGAQVANAVPGGPAASAGMRVGDVIKTVGGKRISDPSQLSTLIAQKQPGDHVTIVVSSGGATRSLDVTLGTRPAGTSSTP